MISKKLSHPIALQLSNKFRKECILKFPEQYSEVCLPYEYDHNQDCTQKSNCNGTAKSLDGNTPLYLHNWMTGQLDLKQDKKCIRMKQTWDNLGKIEGYDCVEKESHFLCRIKSNTSK